METTIVSTPTMKAEQTKCPFCPRVLYWSGRNKHIFSPKHLEEHVRPELLKKDKDELSAYGKESKARPCPKFRIVSGNEVKEVHLCFGCKKAKEHLSSDHLHNCPHARQHRAAMKRLVQSAELGDTNVDEDVPNLKSEIEKLKRKLKHLATAEESQDDEATLSDEQESVSESEEETEYEEDKEEEEVYLHYDKERRIYVVKCSEENPILHSMKPRAVPLGECGTLIGRWGNDQGKSRPNATDERFFRTCSYTQFAVRRGWKGMVDDVSYYLETSTNDVYDFERPGFKGKFVRIGHYQEGRLCLAASPCGCKIAVKEKALPFDFLGKVDSRSSPPCILLFPESSDEDK